MILQSGEFMVSENYKLKLVPVLVPRPLWGINAHDLLDRDSWQCMRHDTFSRDNFHCFICEQKRPLECHEVFSYDDVTGTATLVRLESRCADCHACNHLGRLLKRNRDGFKKALKRIGALNRLNPPEVISLVEQAFQVHKTRTRPWQMKVAEDLLRKYPELIRLEGAYSVDEEFSNNAPEEHNASER
jgi:hypothetical protein